MDHQGINGHTRVWVIDFMCKKEKKILRGNCSSHFHGCNSITILESTFAMVYIRNIDSAAMSYKRA